MVLEATIAGQAVAGIDHQAKIAALRGIATSSLSSLSSEATAAVSEIKGLVRWLDDPRPAFAEDVDGDDKFAQLIDLAGRHPDCSGFFISEVGVNMSTVWRWANNKSRPTRYVGTRLSAETEAMLTDALYGDALAYGLLPAAQA